MACAGYEPLHPLEDPNVTKLPAGAPPAAGPPAGAKAAQWSAWDDAELVVAVHEPHIWGGEDSGHARVMLFADGRALYRVLEEGRWRWYAADLGQATVATLQRDTLADLKGTKSFSCSYGTDQPSTIILARRSKRWVVREAYALHECLADVSGPAYGASTVPVGAPAPEPAPPAFVRAYRRLDRVPEAHAESATRWRTPRTHLLWTIDNGDYMDGPDGEPKGEPWPDTLPKGPAPAEGWILMPFDAAYEDPLRDFIGSGGLVSYRGERWLVQVLREHPGDAAVECALSPKCR